MEMFEKASKLKLRFGTGRGSINTEDLWDLPLTSGTQQWSLDDLARALSNQVKDSAEESFVIKLSKTNATLELKFEIVKHIIKIKLAAKVTAEQAAVRKSQKETILSIISDKKNEALKEMSIEELEKLT